MTVNPHRCPTIRRSLTVACKTVELCLDDIAQLFSVHGARMYGGESASQLQHALETAFSMAYGTLPHCDIGATANDWPRSEPQLS